jgi:hypothetical protein
VLCKFVISSSWSHYRRERLTCSGRRATAALEAGGGPRGGAFSALCDCSSTISTSASSSSCITSTPAASAATFAALSDEEEEWSCQSDRQLVRLPPFVAPRAAGVHPRSTTSPRGRWRICVGLPFLSPAPHSSLTSSLTCSPLPPVERWWLRRIVPRAWLCDLLLRLVGAWGGRLLQRRLQPRERLSLRGVPCAYIARPAWGGSVTAAAWGRSRLTNTHHPASRAATWRAGSLHPQPCRRAHRAARRVG